MPRTDRAPRVIDAPATRIFAALVDRDASESWLPPSGMTGRFEQFDARPGRSYRLALTYTDPSEAGGKSSDDSDIVEARCVEIDRNDRRIVQA